MEELPLIGRNYTGLELALPVAGSSEPLRDLFGEWRADPAIELFD